jgi:hypothetical protein
MDIRKTILKRAGMLKDFPGQKIPTLTPEIREHADKIAAGTVYFYDTAPVEVGLKNVDWSGAHIKHQEWPAQLNRFFHFVEPASAYRETGDEKYAQAARSQMEDWIAQRDYKGSTKMFPGDSTLNMSIRLGTSEHHGWGGTIHAFLKSSAFDDAFLERILESLADQSKYLSEHLTAINNWRISELDALVFTALRFPMLDNADEILAIGIRGMRNALATQFLSDGVHVERTPSYHSWMMSVAASYARLARIFKEADAHVDAETVKKAHEYNVQSSLWGVNDSTAPHQDPENTSGKREVMPPLDQVFPDAGHIFIRSGFNAGDDYIAFDAGTWGGAHCHLSRLSFVCRSGGKMLIADPGILDYEMSNPLASYGKGTPAHSTLNLNGMNQSEASAVLHRTDFTKKTALVHASYQGGYWEGKFYWSFRDGRGKGVYGNHERVLFVVKGEYILVLDTMMAEAGNEVRNCFQSGPAEKWTLDAEKQAWWSGNKDANVLVQLLMPGADVKIGCWEGSMNPIRGWVGSHGNDSVAAPLVEYRYPSAGRYSGVTSAVIVVPFRGGEVPSLEVVDCGSSPDGHIHFVELKVPGGATDYVAWTKGLALPIELSHFVSDARFVWWRKGGSAKFEDGYLVDGSYIVRNNQTVWKASKSKTGLVRG